MSNLATEHLFDAIGTIAASVVESSSRDLTVSASINKIHNAEIGEYQATYKEDIISVYSLDPSVTYNNGEQVYILVPQGDFSNKKIILGKATSTDGSSYDKLNAVKNFYGDRGPNWIGETEADWFKIERAEGQNYPYGIFAAPTEEEFNKYKIKEDSNDKIYFENKILSFDKEHFKETSAVQLNNWSSMYNYIKIQADFQTNLLSEYQQGEYYLSVIVLAKNPKYTDDPESSYYSEEEEEYEKLEFKLGFKDFIGASPYAFAIPSTQTAYFEIPKGGIVYLDSISLKQENMPVDKKLIVDDRGNIITTDICDENNPPRNNILVSNIDIRFAEKVNLSNSLYYAWIEANKGDTFNENINKIPLIAHLWYGDQDLTNENLCEVKWFRRKIDVLESDPINNIKDKHNKTYFDYAGSGWYPIEEIIKQESEIEPLEKLNYQINGNELIIKSEAVPYQWDYKAVIVYYTEEKGSKGEDTGRYQEVATHSVIKTVYNRTGSKLDFSLRIVEDPINNLYVTDSEGLKKYYCTWYIENTNGSYYEIKLENFNNPTNSPINISKYLLSSSATFYAQCYNMDFYDFDHSAGAFDEIAILNITKMRPNASDIQIEWTGPTTFNYDSSGGYQNYLDIDKEYVVMPTLKFAKDKGADYQIKVYIGDVEIRSAEWCNAQEKQDDRSFMDPKDSMMTSIYRDNNNGIHFHIRSTYDPMKLNNIFKAEAIIGNATALTIKSELEITFSKDGDNGTLGNEWKVEILPCNWNVEKEEKVFTKKTSLSPIVIYKNSGTGSSDAKYLQSDNSRLFLRPFVTKGGRALEQLDPYEGYYYKAYWDVRYPSAVSHNRFLNQKEKETVSYSSFLRLHHAYNDEEGVTGERFIYTQSFKEIGDAIAEDVKTNPSEQVKDGLIGYTSYPYDVENSYSGVADGVLETFGAVEVRYFDNEVAGTGCLMSDSNYRFIVKCFVEVYKGSYSNKSGKVIAGSKTERVASIVCYYPVDIIINEKAADPEFTEKELSVLKTNWPQFVNYDARGLHPYQMSDNLEFLDENNKNYRPINLTELVQSISQGTVSNEDKTKEEEYYYKYEAIGHLNTDGGFNGALCTEPERGPNIFQNDNRKCWFIRNQVMMLNLYGNIDINGWDGQGLDMEEQDGTIFGVTLGAGYKGKLSNKFTGVLMGIDKSQPRENIEGYNPGNSKEQNDYMPYLTGLFGYQEGVQSFGLMENGTAYFGRADGGGRIIIDGTNAMIYGGGNGTFKRPSLKDDMWNTVRISLTDLTHITTDDMAKRIKFYDPISDLTGESQETSNTKGISTSVKGTGTTMEGNKYFGFDGENSGFGIPSWYKTMWSKAYIKKYNSLPYWMPSPSEKAKSYGSLTDWSGETQSQMKKDNYKLDYFGKGQNLWIKIYNRNAFTIKKVKEGEIEREIITGIDPVKKNLDSNYKYYVYEKVMNESEFAEQKDYLALMRQFGENIQISNFGPGRASTTPAIEIGQHPDGLMPGLIDYDDYENVFKTLSIPGNRNLLITYDGTLWATNGVFMGAVIGSNIVGGRIQGTEIGVGKILKDSETMNIFSSIKDADCDIYNLIPPIQTKAVVNRQIPWNQTSGRAFSLDADGNLGIHSAKISGGTIDIGSFHIIGEEFYKENSDITPEASKIGHLVQMGESDFIGDTHFFGNIKIVPKLEKDEKGDPKMPTTLSQATISQIGGVAILGGLFVRDNLSSGLQSAHVIQNYANNSNDKKYYSLGSSNLGFGSSLQENAMFSLDTRENNYLKGEYFGHFWPLHMNIKRESFTPPGTGGSAAIRAKGYLALMSQFDYYLSEKEKNDLNDKYIRSLTSVNESCLNYFRIGYLGPESRQIFIRGKTQSDNSCELPSYSDNNDGNYKGYFGTVQRAGEVLDGSGRIDSIGITSWNQNAILLSSDDHVGVKAKESVTICAGARMQKSGNVSEQMNNPEAFKRFSTQLIINGSGEKKLSSTDYSSIKGYTSGGLIGLVSLNRDNVDFKSNLEGNMNYYINGDMVSEQSICSAAMILEGKGSAASTNGGPNAYFYQTVKETKNPTGIHIVAKKTEERSCWVDPSMGDLSSELFLSYDQTVLSGAKSVYIQALNRNSIETYGSPHSPEKDSDFRGIIVTEEGITLEIGRVKLKLYADGPDAKLDLSNIPAENQSGIYARFA